jgi:hypothetical protein
MKNLRFRTVLLSIAIVILALAVSESAGAKGRGDGPVIYVTSQELFFDSIVVADPLPQKGPFQLLEMGGPVGLQTEFGPGDPGYVGGRWWVDVNGNAEMDGEDNFFLCPLLGPGREEP